MVKGITGEKEKERLMEDIARDPVLLANWMEEVDARQAAMEAALTTVIAAIGNRDKALQTELRQIISEKARARPDDAGRTLLLRLAQ
jgi:hypothetical protein